MGWIATFALTAVAATTALAAVAGAQPTATQLSPVAGTPLRVELKPRMAGGTVRAIDVRLIFAAPAGDGVGPLLSMPQLSVLAPSTLADPAALVARDARGPLPLAAEVDPVDPTGFEQGRRWRALRPPQGTITVTYSGLPREITPQTRPGPLYDTRTEGSGFYGSGRTLIAMPVEGWPRRVTLSWDLSEMAAGSRGVTSIGEGTVEAELTDRNLGSIFVMAGPVQSHPPDGSGRFIAYWITPPSFDLIGASRWTEWAYDYFQRFFGQQQRPFRVFMRTTERFQGGGSGGFSSFIFGAVAGQPRDPEDVRGLLAHEALHSFTGAGAGGSGAGGQWYSEGSTSYYTVILPYRAGLTRLDAVQAAFNRLAHSYFTNPRSNLSNADVTRLFFSDSDAQVVPYQRGPLYFALVDARMRAASGGRRRVDELILRYIARPADSDPIGYWRGLVAEALGPAGAAEFDGMMAGAPLDFPGDLLGPCFRGEAQPLARFQLGFRLSRESDGRAIVRQLRPNSAAAAAGVLEGDVILAPGAIEAAEETGRQSDLALRLRRGEQELTISYRPWSEARPGMQWARTSVPEADCGI